MKCPSCHLFDPVGIEKKDCSNYAAEMNDVHSNEAAAAINAIASFIMEN